MLTDRLTTLVEYGVMTRDSYKEPGQRARPAYHLTAAGRELHVIVGAYQSVHTNSGATDTCPDPRDPR